MAGGHPAVEIAHNGNCFGVRRPHAEHRARLAILLFQVAAKVAVGFKVIALMEQVNWQIGRLRR